MDAQHDEYGAERLVATIRGAADRSAPEIVDVVSNDVARFARQGTHIDDKVLIVIKAK